MYVQHAPVDQTLGCGCRECAQPLGAVPADNSEASDEQKRAYLGDISLVVSLLALLFNFGRK